LVGQIKRRTVLNCPPPLKIHYENYLLRPIISISPNKS